MSVNQREADQMIRAIYGFAADLMRQGHSGHQIEQALVEKGLRAEDAHGVVKNLEKERQRQYDQANREAGLRNLVIGGVICAIGLAITIGSYQAAAASPAGGSYVVAWGAVIFGGFQFLKGLFHLMS